MRLYRFVSVVMLVLCSCACIAQPGYAASDSGKYANEVSAWIEHATSHGNFAGVETSGPEFEALQKIGPNVLPALFFVLRETEDRHVRWSLFGAIHGIGRVFVYKHYDNPKDWYAPEDYENPSLIESATKSPLILKCVDGWKQDQEWKEEAKLLLQWWDDREIDRINQITLASLRSLERRLKTDEGFNEKSLLDRVRIREGRTVWSFGVYALPSIVREIGQSDTPELFCIFLGNAARDEYVPFYESKGALYPSRKEKVEYIKRWWKDEKSKYSELTDLYKEIDSAVQEL